MVLKPKLFTFMAIHLLGALISIPITGKVKNESIKNHIFILNIIEIKMFSKLSKKSSDLKKSIQEKSVTGSSLVKDKSKILMSEQWPKIENLIAKGLIDIAEEKINDEDFMNTVFSRSYELLPTIARFALPREKYLAFAHTKRESLFLKVVELKEKKSAIALSNIGFHYSNKDFREIIFTKVDSTFLNNSLYL